MLDHTHEDWKARAAGLSLRSQAFIGGTFLFAMPGKTFDCVNPATCEPLVQVAEGDAEDINKAVVAARGAFDDGR